MILTKTLLKKQVLILIKEAATSDKKARTYFYKGCNKKKADKLINELQHKYPITSIITNDYVRNRFSKKYI